jgi:UDP-arabinose 4-epimerase
MIGGGSLRYVLVTGGAGYVGSHACKALARAGYLPVCYDNLVRGHEWAVKWGPFERGDILDRERLAAVLQRYRPLAVMHFAALAYVGESVDDPAEYYRTNVVGSIELLEAMRSTGVKRLVLSSSCATYGVALELPLRENAPQAPINPYGRSKLMIEQALADYAAAYHLASISLRYFNAAGADPDGEIGEEHAPETHLIPLVLAATDPRRPVTIFGDDYDTPDGTCVRDYVHVSDLADAHVLALGALDRGEPRAVAYNLGSESGASVRQVIAAAQRATGRPIAVRMGARRPGDPPRLLADAGKAKRELGWAPGRSELETIVSTAWKWMNRGSRRS